MTPRKTGPGVVTVRVQLPRSWYLRVKTIVGWRQRYLEDVQTLPEWCEEAIRLEASRDWERLRQNGRLPRNRGSGIQYPAGDPEILPGKAGENEREDGSFGSGGPIVGGSD